MNMPDLNEARKRTKDKVNILYDEYKVPENVKNIGNGKSYALLTYGCQMNVHDSENIAGIMEDMKPIKRLCVGAEGFLHIADL